MELQLGLGQASHGSMPWFDLNKEWLEPKGIEGSKGVSHGYCLHGGGCGYKRQKIDEEVDSQRKTVLLPLVSWTQDPNEGDGDDHKRNRNYQIVPCTKNNKEEKKGTKGWPPIESCRKRFLPSYNHNHQLRHHHHHHHHHHHQISMNNHQLHHHHHHQISMNNHYRLFHNNNRDHRPMATYIKVKMEGVAIGRKINIRCYDSYECLFNTLIAMFDIKNGDDNMMSNYTLKFQDKEGNSLQARDISWWKFIESVQRVEIQRNKNVSERSLDERICYLSNSDIP